MRWTRWRVAGGGTLALALGWAVFAVATRNPHSDDYRPGEITCPFLAMAPPGTRDLFTFVRGAGQNGMNLPMAAFVAMQITSQQKGLLSVLRLEAPDLHRLREVPGVSHDDRYAVYLPELRAQADALAVDGRITYQQLVDLKRWVARRENVTPSDASKIETALAFVRAGGDLESWTVGVEPLFTLLTGRDPGVDVVVTPWDLQAARAAADWSASGAGAP